MRNGKWSLRHIKQLSSNNHPGSCNTHQQCSVNSYLVNTSGHTPLQLHLEELHIHWSRTQSLLQALDLVLHESNGELDRVQNLLLRGYHSNPGLDIGEVVLGCEDSPTHVLVAQLPMCLAFSCERGPIGKATCTKTRRVQDQQWPLLHSRNAENTHTTTNQCMLRQFGEYKLTNVDTLVKGGHFGEYLIIIKIRFKEGYLYVPLGGIQLLRGHFIGVLHDHQIIWTYFTTMLFLCMCACVCVCVCARVCVCVGSEI